MKLISVLSLLASTMAFSAEQNPDAKRPSKFNRDVVFCTMQYDPSTCTFEDISASGSNKCFARASLYSYAASHGIKIDPAKVSCVSESEI